MAENNTIEKIRNIPRSVVGSDKLDILSELVKTLGATQTPTEQVWLPPFRSQVDDARKWLEHVDKVKEEFLWSNPLRTLMFVVGSIFNNLKHWFENWSLLVRN